MNAPRSLLNIAFIELAAARAASSRRPPSPAVSPFRAPRLPHFTRASPCCASPAHYHDAGVSIIATRRRPATMRDRPLDRTPGRLTLRGDDDMMMLTTPYIIHRRAAAIKKACCRGLLRSHAAYFE